jgi:hypothetical protein
MSYDYTPIGDEDGVERRKSLLRYVVPAVAVLGICVAMVLAVAYAGNLYSAKPAEASKPVWKLPPIPYPVYGYQYGRVNEGVYVDRTRQMSDGSYLGNGTVAPGDDYRYIPYIVLRPALDRGSEHLFRIGNTPSIYNGSVVGVPTLNSSHVGLEMRVSYNDSTAAPGQFAVWIIPERQGYGWNFWANELMVLGGNVLVSVYSHNVVTSSCPPPFCADGATHRNWARDARAIKDAIKAGAIPELQYADVHVMSSGMPAFGCYGASASGYACIAAQAGYPAPIAGSPPRETSVDGDIAAVFTGDYYVGPVDPNYNGLAFNASLGVWGSGLYLNWPGDYYSYPNARHRAFYDVRFFDHAEGGTGPFASCKIQESLIHAYQDGRDVSQDASLAQRPRAGSVDVLTQCSPKEMEGWRALPLPLYPLDTDKVIRRMPTAGFLEEDGAQAFLYHWITFSDGVLGENPTALQATILDPFPAFVDGAYLDSVPGTEERPVVLSGKTLVVDIDGCYYDATVFDTPGLITIPPNSTSYLALDTNNTWLNTGDQILDFNLSFSFPLVKGKRLVREIRQVSVGTQGWVAPVMPFFVVGQIYTARRLLSLAENVGAPVFWCFGGESPYPLDIGEGAGDIYITSTPDEFTVTYYRLVSYNLQDYFYAQCSLYPNGTVVYRLDNSTPATIPNYGPGTVNGQLGGDLLIGSSSGRSRVDEDGHYDWWADPHTLLLNGTEPTCSGTGYLNVLMLATIAVNGTDDTLMLKEGSGRTPIYACGIGEYPPCSA